MSEVAMREVHIESRRPYAFGDFQLNYLDYSRRRIIRSTQVFQDNVLLYKSNSLGCIGDEPEPGLPFAVFFGDSCTHGYRARSFVEQVSIPGCQALNAGVEGLTLPWIVDRFEELNARVDVVCAAVHSGWHNICYNERTEEFWAAQLDRISGPPVVAHFRLIGDVNEDAVRLGYKAIFEGRENYGPWRGFDYESEAGRRMFADEIARFNRFIVRYCEERGRILIDLSAVMEPRTHYDLGRAFLDFIHPSPSAYPDMARQIEARLSAPIAEALAARPASP